MTLAETVDKVIALAREVRAYYQRELPRWHPDYPLVHPDEGEPPAPPAQVELQGLLDALPEGDVFALATLMRMGRSDFRAEALGDRFEQTKARYGTPQQAILQMMSQFPLASYLADGRDGLRRRGIDVDKAFLEPNPAA